MFSNEQLCEAIDALRADRRQPTSEAIADRLEVEDVEELDAKLRQAAKDGVVWMVAAWWHRREGDTDETMHYAYYVKRGDPDDDLG